MTIPKDKAPIKHKITPNQSTTNKKLSFSSWEHFKDSLPRQNSSHPSPGNTAKFLVQYGFINRPQSSLYELLCTQSMGTPSLRWQGSRDFLCLQMSWKNVSTVSRNLSALEKVGLVKKHHTPEGTLKRRQCLDLEIVPVRNWLLSQKKTKKNPEAPKIKPLADVEFLPHTNTTTVIFSKVSPPISLEHNHLLNDNDPEIEKAVEKLEKDWNVEKKPKPIKKFSTKNNEKLLQTIQRAQKASQAESKDVLLWFDILLVLGFTSEYRFIFTRKILPKIKTSDFEVMLMDLEFFYRKGSIKEVPRWINTRLRRIANGLEIVPKIPIKQAIEPPTERPEVKLEQRIQQQKLIEGLEQQARNRDIQRERVKARLLVNRREQEQEQQEVSLRQSELFKSRAPQLRELILKHAQ